MSRLTSMVTVRKAFPDLDEELVRIAVVTGAVDGEISMYGTPVRQREGVTSVDLNGLASFLAAQKMTKDLEGERA